MEVSIRTALSSGRTVIGESSGAQRCDTVVVEKSGWAVKSIFVLKRVVEQWEHIVVE